MEVTNYKNTTMNICMIIAVFGSSIIGAQIFGISLNKIALLPLLGYVFISSLSKKFVLSLGRTEKYILFWYLLNIVSCICGMLYSIIADTKTVGIINAELREIIEICAIYLPIVIGIWMSEKRLQYKESMYHAIAILFRINITWGLAQFALYHLFNIRLNTIVFEELFGGSLGSGAAYGTWTNFAYFGGAGVLRVTGLNYDAAYFGIILALGFILEKKFIWKFLAFICAIISFSRTAIVLIVCILLFDLLLDDYGKIKRNMYKKGLFKTIGYTLLAVVIFCFILRNSPRIAESITHVIGRFETIFSGKSTGTNRHILYFKAALEVNLFSLPIINKLFGIGIFCGGCALRFYSSTIPWLSLSEVMKLNTRIWPIEMDYANCILGTGLIGLFVFVMMHYHAYRSNKYDKHTRLIIIALVLGGFMYLYSGYTFIQLVYIIAFPSVSGKMSKSILLKNQEEVRKV